MRDFAASRWGDRRTERGGELPLSIEYAGPVTGTLRSSMQVYLPLVLRTN